jgi:hypothetical protein
MWLMVTISPRVIRSLKLHSAKEKADITQDISKEPSPFTANVDFPPYSSTLRSPSTTYFMSKERTVHYPSSLYSDPTHG